MDAYRPVPLRPQKNGREQKNRTMENKVQQEKSIQINVGLDEEKTPVAIHWQAEDNPAGKKEAKAMLVSFFDAENKDTLKIDLWTNEMQVVEMDRFMYQTLRGLADTYFKATQNAELATDMQRFVQYFGEKTGIVQGGQSKEALHK